MAVLGVILLSDNYLRPSTIDSDFWGILLTSDGGRVIVCVMSDD